MKVSRLVALMAIAAGESLAASQTPAVPIDPVDGIVEAFKTHQVVMLPGGHGDKPAHDLLLKVLRDPRVPGAVSDVVVEFGTSRYQDLIDRFVRGDEGIDFPQLKHVWQDTVIPSATHDNPYVEEFYRTVRQINAALPKEKRFRVLAGDPPIDWDNVITKEDHRKWMVRRDAFPADLIRSEVVARGRRALVAYGQLHCVRHEIQANYDMSSWQAQTMTSLLERDGVNVFAIWSEGGAAAAKLQSGMETWTPRVMALVRGTPLGAADFTVFVGRQSRYVIRGIDDFVEIPTDQYKPMRMEDQVDAILWNPNPPEQPLVLSQETCADSAYVPMRLHRITVAGLPPGEANAVKKACGVQ